MSMTVDEMIVVLEGYKAGKQIQLRSRNQPTLEWNDCGTDPGFVNFLLYDYRVKPKPREWWVYDCAGRAPISKYADLTREEAERGRCAKCREVIHVREVLPEVSQ